MGTHSSKYKAKENTSRLDTTQKQKKKQKQIINKNQVKTLFGPLPMLMTYNIESFFTLT